MMTLFHSGDPGTDHVLAVGPSPNPHTHEWSYEHGTTKRLATICGKRVPFANLFEFEPPKWDRKAAKIAADNWQWENDHRGLLVLMLGTKVCDAFGVKQPHWLTIYELNGDNQGMAVPHPSGLNRWWNDDTNIRAAKYMLRAMVEER
jgi:hypothetical protein